MATHSASPWWNGLRHPLHAVFKRAFKRVFKRWSEHASTASDRLPPETGAAPVHDCQSSERLERIAAYARSGYFNTEYTAGMFIVPLDTPLE
jgi:hypothetical protein